MVVLSRTNRKTGHLRAEDQEKSIDEMSEFGPVSSGTCQKQSVSGLYFALVSLSRTNRKTGYLRPEDEEKSVDAMSKFGPV